MRNKARYVCVLCCMVLLAAMLCACKISPDVAMCQTAEDFLRIHYSMTLVAAEEVAVLAEQNVPEKLAEEIAQWMRQRYEGISFSQAGLECIASDALPITLIKIVENAQADIEISSIEITPKASEEKQSVPYTVQLKAGESTFYKVTGVINFSPLEDGWQIEYVKEHSWAPKIDMHRQKVGLSI